jgi:uncharacterized protein YcfL
MKKIVVLFLFFMFIASCGGSSTTNIYIYSRNVGDSVNTVDIDSNSTIDNISINDTSVILSDHEQQDVDK